jgi:hypothetical protein
MGREEREEGSRGWVISTVVDVRFFSLSHLPLSLDTDRSQAVP